MLFTKCNILVSIRLCPIPVNGRLLTCQAFFWALGRKFVNASCNSLPAVAPKSCPRLIVLSTWKQLGVCDRVPVEHVVSGDISCFSFPIALFGKAAHRNHKERRRSRYRFVISVFFFNKGGKRMFSLVVLACAVYEYQYTQLCILFSAAGKRTATRLLASTTNIF